MNALVIVSLDTRETEIPIVNVEGVIVGEDKEEVKNRAGNMFSSLLLTFVSENNIEVSEENIKEAVSDGYFYQNPKESGYELHILSPETLRVLYENDKKTDSAQGSSGIGNE